MVLVLSMMLKTCMSAFEEIFIFNLLFCGTETLNFLHIAVNLLYQLKQNFLAICTLKKKNYGKEEILSVRILIDSFLHDL